MAAPGPFQKHSETSRQAAIARSETNIELCFKLLQEHEQGLTDQEMEARFAAGGNAERPARVALVSCGLVVDSDRVRATSTGRNAVVWTLAPGAVWSPDLAKMCKSSKRKVKPPKDLRSAIDEINQAIPIDFRSPTLERAMTWLESCVSPLPDENRELADFLSTLA
jgi:hypothetical protein